MEHSENLLADLVGKSLGAVGVGVDPAELNQVTAQVSSLAAADQLLQELDLDAVEPQVFFDPRWR